MNNNTDCPQPRRHKMALLTFLGLLLPVQIIPPALQTLLPHHQVLAVSISVAFTVGLMSYFTTPLLTTIAGDWLHR